MQFFEEINHVAVVHRRERVEHLHHGQIFGFEWAGSVPGAGPAVHLSAAAQDGDFFLDRDLFVHV